LDIVTVWVADIVPTVRLPYVSAAGDTLNAPAATPVPVALIVALPPLLRIADVSHFWTLRQQGQNVILNVALPPAAIEGCCWRR